MSCRLRITLTWLYGENARRSRFFRADAPPGVPGAKRLHLMAPQPLPLSPLPPERRIDRDGVPGLTRSKGRSSEGLMMHVPLGDEFSSAAELRCCSAKESSLKPGSWSGSSPRYFSASFAAAVEDEDNDEDEEDEDEEVEEDDDERDGPLRPRTFTCTTAKLPDWIACGFSRAVCHSISRPTSSVRAPRAGSPSWTQTRWISRYV